MWLKLRQADSAQVDFRETVKLSAGSDAKILYATKLWLNAEGGHLDRQFHYMRLLGDRLCLDSCGVRAEGQMNGLFLRIFHVLRWTPVQRISDLTRFFSAFTDARGQTAAAIRRKSTCPRPGPEKDAMSHEFVGAKGYGLTGSLSLPIETFYRLLPYG
jgi:hypothetical protein